MSNPNEARQIAYLALVQALLRCPPNHEERILAEHAELVDLGLVMTLLAVAQRMMQIDDPRSISTIEWLANFTQQLAKKLGIDIGESPVEEDEEYETFLLELLQTVFDSDGDWRIVRAYLEGHLNYLNQKLLAIFPQQVEKIFALKTEPQWKLFVAATLNNLAVCFCRFTGGKRSINLELAIACYDRALLVYTLDLFPKIGR